MKERPAGYLRLRQGYGGQVMAGLVITSLFFFGQAGWIYAKAGLAQVLMEGAWARTLAGEQRVKPWSWADTWPVARLTVPRLDKERLILEGASGRTLAFAPGHLTGSAPPGTKGNTVVAGHRDTHFAFLQDLEEGDLLVVGTPDGREHRYWVESLGIVHEGQTEVLEPSGKASLTLVTCYPFDAVVPGGPLRFVVRAEALSCMEEMSMNEKIANLDVDAQVEAGYRMCDRAVPGDVVCRVRPLRAPFCPVCLEQEWPVEGLRYWGVCATINFVPLTAQSVRGRLVATCSHCNSVNAVSLPERFLWFPCST
jgi:sortase A